LRQLDVQIMGQSYLLGCPDGGEAQLQSAVARVDSAMCKIRDAGKVRARDRIAVLAALNLAFDLDQAAPRGSRLNGAEHTVENPAGDTARITALLARLDAALGEDGRLL
jgi:cell division protein ZapA